MSAPFNLVFGIDAEYTRQLRVLWTSLFAQHAPGSLLLHVLTPGLGHRQESALLRLAGTHQAPCHFHHVSFDRVRHLPVKPGFPSSVQFYRFFLHEFMPPGVTRVLYLDSDTLVLRNLAPLMEAPLGDKTVGAVEDLDRAASCARLGLPPEEGYFNSGVLLIDLATWQANAIPAKAQDYLVKHSNNPSLCRYPDQDALNVTLQRAWQPLPAEWNAYACYRWFQPAELSPRQQAAVLNPGIIHFIGPEKPWLPGYATPYQKQYRFFARQAGIRFPWSFSLTAHRNRRKQGQTLQHMHRLHQAAGLGNDF